MPEGKPYSRSAPPPAGKGQDRGVSLGATHSRGSVVFSPPEPCVGGMDLEAPGCGWCVLPTVLPGGPLLAHPPSVSSAASPPYGGTAPAPRAGVHGLHVFSGYQCKKCYSAKGRLAVPRFSDCRFQMVRCLQRLSAGQDATAVPSGGFYSQFLHFLQESPEQGAVGEVAPGTRAGCRHLCSAVR